MPETTTDQPLVVVTTDSHIGPRLKEDLRDYCPKQYLEEYDDYVRGYEPHLDPTSMFRVFNPDFDVAPRSAEGFQVSMAALKLNATAGHHDVHARLKDMDRDGVAGEIIYHGSQNGHPFPFLDPSGGTFNAQWWTPTGSARELELAAVGQQMYNRWLADQCSVEPERHVGLAHLPMWDIDAAIQELERAHSSGLTGINLPGPKPGIKPYDDLAWDAFWAICEERGIALSTHDGAGFDDLSVRRPHMLIALSLEGDLPRKMFPRLIFGGTFERFPNLKLALTELQHPASAWWTQLCKRYDQIWEANLEVLRAQVPRPPSEYISSNVFLGQSYLHAVPSEVTIAVRDGYASNFMWGSDYPHQESVYRPAEDDDVETRTQLGLRNALHSAPPDMATAILGETAARVYSMDLDKLKVVARRIGAMTLDQLLVPPVEVPDEWAVIARTQNPYPEFHGMVPA
jgi:predicted TIM-barrel fold metal-dependent hydrolase